MKIRIFPVMCIMPLICGFSSVAARLLRGLGIEHSRIFANGEAGGCYFVVRAMTVEFLKPALMDDVLFVATCVSGIGGASIEMSQEIRRRHEVLLTARVRIAVVAGGKARRIPVEILEKLKAIVAA